MSGAKTAALKAFRLFFRPVAQMLLRAGVNWREVAELGKATFVEVATRDFGIRGRPTNISRVAILTGFSRREVRRLRDLLDSEDEASFERINYATRLLSGWWQDPDYTDDEGRPRLLKRSGEDPSFESLCERYSGDVPASTVLKELLHVGAIAEVDDGRLEARSRVYIPVLMDPEQMLRSGKVLEDIGDTVAYNLHRGKADPSRFERRATNTQISHEHLPEFREFIEQEGQAFLEKVDAWLTDHEMSAGDTTPGDTDNVDSVEAIRLGMGAYWIEETQTRTKS